MASLLPILSNAPSGVRPQELAPVEVRGLYAHIPFCSHKCHYCDFYSITRQTEQRMAQFVDLMLREADLWAAGRGPVVRPATVFFGGGTPSLLPPAQMARLIEGLRRRFDFSGVEEFTIEANPATVSPEYCATLRGLGVDRLSFGAQSFDRAQLALLERHHDPDDVPASVEMARAAGFERLNLDLIYAIPGQTLESWMDSLEKALALGVEHLSCYGLTYEPNAPIAVKKRLGQLQAAEEALELEMLHATRRRLAAAGMPAYEISNYARRRDEGTEGRRDGGGGREEGRKGGSDEEEKVDAGRRGRGDAGTEKAAASPAGRAASAARNAETRFHPSPSACLHNLLYWNGGDYVGLGPAAASHVRGVRWRNRPHLGEWEAAIGRGELSAIEVEHLSPPRRAGELAMLQLRLAHGVGFADFAARTGYDARAVYSQALARLRHHGLIVADERGFRLSEAGIDVADAVAAEFLAAAE